jgi:thiosulfate/3-mercaptopyruvate sulfurtransferase
MRALTTALFFFQITGVPLVQPNELASRLIAKPGSPLAVFHVGPNVLYRSKHIPGAIYAGPASKPEGLSLLQDAAANIPRTSEIVIYCGCCPWDRCPNIKPAFDRLKQMGFTKVKALYLENNFAKDWIDHQYPIAR